MGDKGLLDWNDALLSLFPQLRNAGGLEPLVELLHSDNNEVRRNACWAVLVCGKDEPTTHELCRLGYVSRSINDLFLDIQKWLKNDANDSQISNILGHLLNCNKSTIM